MLRGRIAVYAAAVSGRPWAGYVRVSRVGTRGGESFRSPTDQTAEIEAWAARRGEHVQMLPPELDASGGTMSRYRGGGAARGIRPVWPDTDAPGVLRVHDG